MLDASAATLMAPRGYFKFPYSLVDVDRADNHLHSSAPPSSNPQTPPATSTQFNTLSSLNQDVLPYDGFLWPLGSRAKLVGRTLLTLPQKYIVSGLSAGLFFVIVLIHTVIILPKMMREAILKTSGGIIQKTKTKFYGTIDLLDILIIYKEELLKEIIFLKKVEWKNTEIWLIYIWIFCETSSVTSTLDVLDLLIKHGLTS